MFNAFGSGEKRFENGSSNLYVHIKTINEGRRFCEAEVGRMLSFYAMVLKTIAEKRVRPNILPLTSSRMTSWSSTYFGSSKRLPCKTLVTYT